MTRAAMTEEEFMRGFADLRGSGKNDFAAAKEMAQRAGVVFAPTLPERLELDSRGFLRPEGSADYGFDTEEQREAAYRAAVDRYNAYVALKSDAEWVVLKNRDQLKPPEITKLAARLRRCPK